MELVQKASTEPQSCLNCPECQKQYLIPKKDFTITDYFPENKLFFQITEYHKSNKTCFECTQNFVCLNKNCIHLIPFCEFCRDEFHGTCNHLLIMDHGKAKESIRFEVPNLEIVFPVLRIKQTIETKINALRDKLMNLVNQFSDAFNNEIRLISKCEDEISHFKLNHEIYDLKICPKKNENHIVKLKNESKLLESVCYVSEKFQNKIWQKIDSQIHRLILDETNVFGNLNTKVFKKERSLFESLQNKNRQILADIFGKQIQIDKNTSFLGYFKNLKAVLERKKIDWAVVKNTGINCELLESMNSAFSEIVCGEQLSRFSIEKRMKEFLDFHTGDQWTVAFEYAHFFNLDQDFCKYALIQVEGYCLTVSAY